MKFYDYLFRTSEESLDEKALNLANKARSYPKSGHILILAGGAGCYPKGTEFFNGEHWKPIEEYKNEDKVLQFDPLTNEATLVYPIEFHDLKTTEFINIKNRRVDFTTSIDHKHLFLNEKTKKLETKTTEELLSKHNSNKRGNKGSLLTSFNYSGEGIDLSDDNIRLRIAIIADGSYIDVKNGYKVRVKLKKKRKKICIENLLLKCGIQYVTYNGSDGYTTYCFYVDFKEKEFESYWYKASKHQMEVICDEVLKWDGSVEKNSFFTTSKKSFDFIQFAFSSLNKSTSVFLDEREGRPTCYCLHANNSRGFGISKNTRSNELNTTTFNKINSEDDKYSDRMYCFTVPTGFFVVRQKNQIYVSGNSGKSFINNSFITFEGKYFNVDDLKSKLLKYKPKTLVKKFEEYSGRYIESIKMSDPGDVALLHMFFKAQGTDKAMMDAFFTAAQAASEKPNVIFDVTLKDFGKLKEISEYAEFAGYDKKNIHIVWILNDIHVAYKQNKDRERSVPDKIFFQTHTGASLTMKEIIDNSNEYRKYADGEIWVIPNRAKKDNDIVMTKVKDKDGEEKTVVNYVKFYTAFKTKYIGKASLKVDELEKEIFDKIQSYVPDEGKW